MESQAHPPEPESYEDRHVHQVYQQIAPHFSSTRYKPWPIVERFLKELPAGSVGLDVGCGNGKYLAVDANVFIVASDRYGLLGSLSSDFFAMLSRIGAVAHRVRSSCLAGIAARHQPHDAIIADNLTLPHPRGRFDFAISIAVVHHLSTPERRVAALREILACLRPRSVPSDGPSGPALTVRSPSAAKALIYVWALEQKSSRRGWDESHEQDVMVPWVMKGPSQASKALRDEEMPGAVASPIADLSRVGVADQSRTFQRYYHLYRSGELEHDIGLAGGTILDAGYEKDNWWAIAAR